VKTESIFIYSFSLAYKYSYKEGTNCSDVAKHQHAAEQGACKMAGQFGGIMLYSCMTDKTETGLAGTLTVIADSVSFYQWEIRSVMFGVMFGGTPSLTWSIVTQSVNCAR